MAAPLLFRQTAALVEIFGRYDGSWSGPATRAHAGTFSGDVFAEKKRGGGARGGERRGQNQYNQLLRKESSARDDFGR